MKYNRIYKPTRFDNFTIVPTYILRHKGISIGATGLYAWLFSHTSNQEITVKFICGHFKENQSAIRNKLNELIKFGYLVRKRVYENGKIIGIDYYLHDNPKNLNVENLHKENLNVENQPQSNINNNIYNKSNINQNANIDKSFEHFVDLFDFKYRPKTKTQINNWKKCLELCVKIDKYDLKDIYLTCKFIRNNEFWRDNFLSLLKLRNKDKNGILYIHRFIEIYKKENKPKCFWKIKGIKQYVIYNDPDGSNKLGAITKTNKLNEFNISQFLNRDEIQLLKNFVNGDR